MQTRKTKDTPLHIAVSSAAGDVVVVKTLLEHGADRRVRNAKGQTALQLALEARKLDAVRLLSGAPPQVNGVTVTKLGSKAAVITWPCALDDQIPIADCYEVDIRSIDGGVSATPSGTSGTPGSKRPAAPFASPTFKPLAFLSPNAGKSFGQRETPLASATTPGGGVAVGADGGSPATSSARLLESTAGTVAIRRTFIRRLNTCHLRPLEAGRTYSVNVRAHNLCGWGPFSATPLFLSTQRKLYHCTHAASASGHHEGALLLMLTATVTCGYCLTGALCDCSKRPGSVQTTASAAQR